MSDDYVWVEYKGYVAKITKQENTGAFGFKADLSDDQIDFWIPRQCVGTITTEKTGDENSSDVEEGEQICSMRIAERYAWR